MLVYVKEWHNKRLVSRAYTDAKAAALFMLKQQQKGIKIESVHREDTRFIVTFEFDPNR